MPVFNYDNVNNDDDDEGDDDADNDNNGVTDDDWVMLQVGKEEGMLRWERAVTVGRGGGGNGGRERRG